MLWYVLLKLSFDIFQTTLVLPILSFVFAAAVAWYLLWRSPLPILLSTLIIFGSWGLYEYGVNARNYGIAAFLFLLFADIKTRYPQFIISHFVVLALLVQTNIYAALMAVLIAAWMMLEAIIYKNLIKKNTLGLFLVLISFAIVLIITLPNDESLVIVNEQKNLKVILKAWDVGYGFTDLLYVPFSYKHGFLTAVLYLSLGVFINQPRVLLLMVGSLVMMCFFALYFRMNFIQHQGMWIFLYITMFWIHYQKIKDLLLSTLLSKCFSVAGLMAFSLILIGQVSKAKDDYNFDINALRSDSKDAGLWFKNHIKKGDILLAEPDYIMESVMYYYYHPFYLPREGVFNTYVHFTKKNKEIISLNQLHQLCDSFAVTGQSTYLILGKYSHIDTVYQYSYNKKFVVDKGALNTLNSNYQLMDSFNHNWFCDEHYFIYKRKTIK